MPTSYYKKNGGNLNIKGGQNDDISGETVNCMTVAIPGEIVDYMTVEAGDCVVELNGNGSITHSNGNGVVTAKVQDVNDRE